ncbi:MAG: AAA family ATPase [Paracoccus sp. (in: a-proteobacteria)]|uniref:AAA family ATPase n=1 Tax=Paracoccus sp. TaxID=267 RepID=UPI0026E0264D|nr:AAA family ATPase [Paracoccus sp. (in: a-proteobacteria)]MDO5623036.1 AAA family ATPase [Paracoccus sp. (in: a-proteobacteria)]
MGDLVIEERTAVQIVLHCGHARSIGDADENASGHMTRVADAADRIAQQLTAHVMLVHHTGKDIERGSRGSSALRGAVDTELSLVPMKQGLVRVAQEKQRTMPKGDDVFFMTQRVVLGLDEDEDERTTVKAIEAKAPARLNPAKPVQGPNSIPLSKPCCMSGARLGTIPAALLPVTS